MIRTLGIELRERCLVGRPRFAHAAGSGELKGITETLTLSPYGSASTANTQLTRNGGAVVINLNNTGLLTENAVKVVWTVNYLGAPNDRPTIRQTVAILGKGGVAK